MKRIICFLLFSFTSYAQDIPNSFQKYLLLSGSKGYLYTSTVDNDYKLAPGGDGLCLLTNSTTTTGLEWGSCSGGSGAPVGAQYWTGASDATLSAEKNLGALSTGFVINTGGVPSAYSGTSCTNQFPRSLDASGAATCASVSLTADVTGTLAQARGGTGAGALTCSAGQALSSNGTAYSCTSTLTAADVACSGTCVSDAEISAVATTKLTGTITNEQITSLDASKLTGTISMFQIGTTYGVASSRTFLRGDGIWAVNPNPVFPPVKENPFLARCNAVRKYNCSRP